VRVVKVTINKNCKTKTFFINSNINPPKLLEKNKNYKNEIPSLSLGDYKEMV